MTPEPPDYKLCKEYLNFFVNRFDILEILYGFVYADEQVYSRLLHLIQKILYKRNRCMGYRDWFVDSVIIAPGSAEQGFEGKHYFRSMRLHK